ncbi:MAG: urate oxidase, partial [Actinomycetota bacterium]|nr:urate oxidase [Actinomycetota bacterium]
MGITLGPNQYGKAEVRVVTVDRSTAHHVLRDLNVSTALRGDFTAVHLEGDNGHVLATDTQKNTVFAFARDGIGEIEDFAGRLARH